MSTAPELWLFTTEFPYGHGETFLENELPVLAEHFQRIRILPLRHGGTARPVPSNVVVRPHVLDEFRMATPGELIAQRRDTARLLTSLWKDAPSAQALWKHHRMLRSRVRALVMRARAVREELSAASGPVILYAYWLHDLAAVAALVRKDRPVMAVARAHGFDLYADRNAEGWIPFRSLHMRDLDRVYCIAQHGARYLAGRFPEAAQKVMLSRLGTADHGMAPWAPADRLRVVSCSNLIPLKRVHLIAEALRSVQVPVEWTHFGDGPERARVERVCAGSPAHVKVDLRGRVPNSAIIDHYRTQPVDVFLHVSEHEGLPVSLMEAASFGIPLLACDAGGVSELVSPRTGELLDVNITPSAIAGRMDAFLGGPMHTVAFRAGVREAWAADLRAQTNFALFADDLLGLT